MLPGRGELVRVVASLVAAEIAAARGDAFDRSARTRWAAQTPIGPGGVGADSVDLIAVATAVADFFSLHEAGVEDTLLADRTIGAWASLAAQSDDAGCAHISFRTSGTTATPKRVSRRRAALGLEAARFADLFRGTARVVSLVPPHHIYGFVHTVLVPAALGIPVDDREFGLRTAVLRSLAPGDLVVATPHVWAEVARLGMPIPCGVRGLSSGAAMPRQTWDALLALGLEGLTDIYGSTETGAIGLRSGPDDPFEAFDPAAARAAGQDRLAWIGETRFRVGERTDRCVQIGGVNVSPEHIEAVLSQHPAVAACAVRPHAHGHSPRLAAFIVPADTGAPDADLLAALITYAERRLPPVARPVSWTFGERLPLGPAGKPVSWLTTGAAAAA